MKKMIYIAVLAMFSVAVVAADKKTTKVLTIGDTSMAEVDTTATEQCGWGQVLNHFLAEGVEVKDLAQEGKSTRQMFNDGSWGRLKNEMEKGSVVLLQFCDFDLRQANPNNHSSIVEFQTALQQMVKDVKKKGCVPVLCTPVAHNVYSLETGALVERHGGYAESVRRVAKANGVYLLDINERTLEWLRGISNEDAAKYYLTEGEDAQIKLTKLGAEKVARLAAEEIKAEKVKKLSKVVEL